jgi:membrane-associated phospholipid phosphatase
VTRAGNHADTDTGTPCSPEPDRGVDRCSVGFRAYLRLAIPVATLFAVVYFGANWLAAHSPRHYRLYFNWELSIPFVPAMIYVYASILILFLLPPLLLKRHEFAALARAMVAVILVAAASFLLLPAEPGFQRPAHVPGYDAVFQALYALDQPYNLVPSLHIACAALCVAALLHAGPRTALKLGLLLWAVLLSVSVLLVHQHHLLDVVTGWLLGLAAYRLVYLPRAP